MSDRRLTIVCLALLGVLWPTAAADRSAVGQDRGAPAFRIHTLGFIDQAHTDPELGSAQGPLVRQAIPDGGIVGNSDQFQGPELQQ